MVTMTGLNVQLQVELEHSGGVAARGSVQGMYI